MDVPVIDSASDLGNVMEYIESLSKKRDVYTTELEGDSHVRGLRISVNSTITAGGRTVPIFVCVYGLSSKEMPGDEIIVCRIEGFVVASNLNGSTQDGFILFLRGSEETTNLTDNLPMAITEENDEDFDDSIECSKDSKIAQIYIENKFTIHILWYT